MAALADYLNLITSEHRQQPDYTSVLTALIKPLVDANNFVLSLPANFDLDVAIGAQLDIVGQWIGVTRILKTPINNVYFTLDSDTLGLDFGVLQGPFDPTSGLIILPDDSYRTLLRAEIISNSWDGTIPQAYAAWDALFAAQGITIFIQNTPPASMHIIYGLLGPTPDAVTLALFTGGYLSLKPAGVLIDSYEVNTLPYFALDSNTAPLGGLDVGAFATIVG